MTEQEYLIKAKELSDRLAFVDATELSVAEKKAAYDAIKSATKESLEKENSAIHTLNLEMRAGIVVREAEALRVYDFEKEIIFWRRSDNGDIVPGSIRKMTEEERSISDDVFEQQTIEDALKGTPFTTTEQLTMNENQFSEVRESLNATNEGTDPADAVPEEIDGGSEHADQSAG